MKWGSRGSFWLNSFPHPDPQGSFLTLLHCLSSPFLFLIQFAPSSPSIRGGFIDCLLHSPVTTENELGNVRDWCYRYLWERGTCILKANPQVVSPKGPIQSHWKSLNYSYVCVKKCCGYSNKTELRAKDKQSWITGLITNIHVTFMSCNSLYSV